MFEKVELTGTIIKILEYGEPDELCPWMECLMRVDETENIVGNKVMTGKIVGKNAYEMQDKLTVKVHFTLYDGDIKAGTKVKGRGFFAEGVEPMPEIDVKNKDDQMHFTVDVMPVVVPVGSPDAKYYSTKMDDGIMISPLRGPKIGRIGHKSQNPFVHTFKFKPKKKVKMFFMDEGYQIL